MDFDYHEKKFRVLSSSQNSQTDDQTIFHYQQDGTLVWANYHGGEIVKGHLLGHVDPATGCLEMRYHHIDQYQQLCTGICHSTPRLSAENKIQLHETWQWTCKDHSRGTSVLEEI